MAEPTPTKPSPPPPIARASPNCWPSCKPLIANPSAPLDGLLVGLQLTHSGRFCKPHDHARFEPRIAYHHPLLDAKFKIDPNDNSIVWTDDELDALIDDYVAAAHLAHDVGYQFVDVKACHGYLLHEFLSARRRPGKFGGDLAGRSRLMCSIIERIHERTAATL